VVTEPKESEKRKQPEPIARNGQKIALVKGTLVYLDVRN
jgi:hypothetical protein